MSELHKNLLAIAGLVLIATAATHYFLLEERIARNTNLRDDNQKKADELAAMKIPELRMVRDYQRLKPGSMKTQKLRYDKLLAKRFVNLYDVLERANEEFKVIYDPQSLDRPVSQWRGEVLSLDYSTKFHEVKDDLKRRQIFLWEPVLGLGKEELAKRDEYYRLIAQLHVVERLAVLAKDNGLDLSNPEWIDEILKTDTKNGGKWEGPGKPAMIRVLPPRSYYAVGQTEPYADEFPVQLSLRGTMASLCRFLDGLTQGGRFLPLEKIEVNVMNDSKYNNANSLPHETKVEARIVCSGFLVLSDLNEMRTKRVTGTKTKPPLPPGA